MTSIERPPSLTSIVAERLRNSIVDGTIELGTLLSEKVLGEQYGTSKTPVREAIAQLQAQGLVEVLPQRGWIVFQPDVEQVRELCEVRLELELIAFRLSMERNRDAFEQSLTAIVKKMGAVYDVERPLAYQRLDNAFHQAFFDHCGNSLLVKAYALFSPRIGALRTHLSTPQPSLLERSLSEHRELARLVKKGDRKRALEILRKHIDRTQERHSALLRGTNKHRKPA